MGSAGRPLGALLQRLPKLFFVVLNQCPFVPKVCTDCQALLTTALAGPCSATRYDRTLARVWSKIVFVVGEELQTTVSSKKLVWVPAHKSVEAVGKATKSDGQKLTMLDWRANRLVDALAKTAAAHIAAPNKVVKFLQKADSAAAHAACLLGIVTHAANNHTSSEIGDGGHVVVTVSRDSSEWQWARPVPTEVPLRNSCASASSCKAVAPPGDNEVAPWKAPTPQVMANRLRRAASDSCLAKRVEDIGARLAAPSTRATATDRLAALRARVQAKLPAAAVSAAEAG